MKYVEDYIDDEEIDWYFHFMYLKDIKDIENKEIEKTINFLCDKISFDYDHDLNRENPFEPMAVFKNMRSICIQDLSEDDLKLVEKSIPLFKSNIIKGKLYDVLYVALQEKEYLNMCVDCYIKYFYDNYICLRPSQYLPPLKRVLFLSSSLKNKDKLKYYIDELTTSYVYKDKDQEIIVINTISKFIESYYKKLYSTYIDKFENVLNDNKHFDDVYLELCESIINYYKSTRNESKIKKYTFKYVDACRKINKMQKNHGYRYINKAINILGGKYQDKIDKLRFELDQAQEELYNSFKFIPIPIDNHILERRKNATQIITSQLQKLKSGVKQFIFLLNNSKPLSVSEIAKMIRKEKGSLLINLADTIEFNSNKKIVYESSKASKDKEKEHYTSKILFRHILTSCEILFFPFLSELIIDEDFKQLIKEIIEHNELVQKKHINAVYNSIMEGFSLQTVRPALYRIIPLLEDDLREFLKRSKIYPISTSGGQDKRIDLNHMIVKRNNEYNRFRAKISKILNNDLMLTLEYLLCRPLSGNIRNEYFHYGISETNQCTHNEVAAFIYIIEAYCLAYDPDINKKVP